MALNFPGMVGRCRSSIKNEEHKPKHKKKYSKCKLDPYHVASNVPKQRNWLFLKASMDNACYFL